MNDGTFRRYTLTEHMRLRASSGADTTHREWLLGLGDGTLPFEAALHPYATPLPPHLCMPDGISLKDFLAWVYPDVRARATACFHGNDDVANDAWFRERSILTPLNALAAQLNEKLLELLDPATATTAISIDTIADAQGDDGVNFPTEFLNSLSPSGLPPHKLQLRLGAIVIILRNLDKERGICNGCRCIVLEISPCRLDVRVLTGRAKGQRLLLPRIPFRSSTG